MGQGHSLGNASGSITINVSQLAAAQAAVNAFASSVNRQMGSITPAANNAQTSVDNLASTLTKLGSAIGFSFGIAGAVKLGQLELDANRTATAYARQEVAARSLAGSQAQLNLLLEAYDEATGGVVDKATALSNVINLQATGFADNAQELTKFAQAARGISLAKGLDPAYVLSQIQLAINNTSTMRLDQIGIDAAQVTARVKELQAANKQMSDQMAFQTAILEQADQKFGALAKSAAGSATGAENAAKSWGNFKLALGQLTGGGVSSFFNTLATNIDELSRKFQGIADDINRAHSEWTQFQKDMTGPAQSGGGFGGDGGRAAPTPWWKADPLGDWLATHQLGEKEGEGLWFNQVRDYRLPSLPSTFGDKSGIGSNIREAPTAMSRQLTPLDEENISKVKLDWAKGVQDLNQQTNDAILQQTNSYNDQRSGVERDYQTSTLRAQEDFGLQRAREEADLADSISRIRRDSAQREEREAQDLARSIAQAESDSAERIADAKKDANERLTELDENYARDEEKRQRHYKESIADAAGNLDAKAVAEAQRNFEEQEQDAKDAHDDQRDKIGKQLQERLDDEAQSLAKSIAQQQDAYNRQLQDGRDADAQRIQDMQTDAQKRREQEDVDYGIRMTRMQQDHDAQLAEMETQQGKRLQQIVDHANQEIAQQDDQHKRALVALGVLNDAWIAEEKRVDDLALKEHDRFLQTQRLDALGQHADALQGSVTPNFNNAYAVPSAYSGANGGTSISRTMGNISFAIYAAPGQSPNDIADAVDARLKVHLEDWANN